MKIGRRLVVKVRALDKREYLVIIREYLVIIRDNFC